MSLTVLLFDAGPSGSAIGAAVAAAFLLMFLGVAFVAFKALKKTVKMAVRMTIVAVILLIAVAGSISLWYLSSSGGQPKLRPPAEKRR